MIALLARYKLLAEIVVIGAIAAGALYAFHTFCESLREEGRQEVRAEDARLAAQKEAADRKVEAVWNQRIQKAENDATANQQMLQTVLSSSGKSLDSLRNAVNGQASANQLPGATLDALRASTAALSTVFLDCAARYRAMGENADGHALDVRTLQQSWPNQPQGEVK